MDWVEEEVLVLGCGGSGGIPHSEGRRLLLSTGFLIIPSTFSSGIFDLGCKVIDEIADIIEWAFSWCLNVDYLSKIR